MSTFGPTQIEVEDPSTNGDLSVGVGDTCSINSDVSSSTHMENSYSIIHSQAVSTVPPAVVYATSRSSRFFGPLLCCVRRRRKPKDSAKHPSSSSYQAELDIHECIARLEEKIKSCQVHVNNYKLLQYTQYFIIDDNVVTNYKLLKTIS